VVWFWWVDTWFCITPGPQLIQPTWEQDGHVWHAWGIIHKHLEGGTMVQGSAASDSMAFHMHVGGEGGAVCKKAARDLIQRSQQREIRIAHVILRRTSPPHHTCTLHASPCIMPVTWPHHVTLKLNCRRSCGPNRVNSSATSIYASVCVQRCGALGAVFCCGSAMPAGSCAPAGACCYLWRRPQGLVDVSCVSQGQIRVAHEKLRLVGPG
jgi:hypothetical protein